MKLGRHRKTTPTPAQDTTLTLNRLFLGMLTNGVQPSSDQLKDEREKGYRLGRQAERKAQGGLAPLPRVSFNKDSLFSIGFKRYGSATLAILQIFTTDSEPYPGITATGLAVLNPGDADDPVLGRSLAFARALRTAGVQLELEAFRMIES